MENRSYDDWKTVFKTGFDYEAELVSDRLNDADIHAVIMNKRDHALNLTIGDMAQIKVMVPADKEAAALALLSSAPFTDAELSAAAMAASPFDEDAEEEDEDDDSDDAS